MLRFPHRVWERCLSASKEDGLETFNLFEGLCLLDLLLDLLDLLRRKQSGPLPLSVLKNLLEPFTNELLFTAECPLQGSLVV